MKKIFGLDLRSLGLFRLLLGLILLLDCAFKIYLARDLYSDWGLMPRIPWIQYHMNSWAFSFHLAMGETWFQVFLILIQMVCSFCFFIGYRVKIFGLVTFILLCSLQSRNYLFLTGADDLIRLALLWSLFLPIDQAFSLSDKNNKGTYSSISSFAFFVQLILVYLTTAFLKLSPVWTRDFSAVYYALNLELWAKPLGYLIRQNYPLTQILTFLTITLELIGPLLLLIPGRTRFFVSLSFIIMHLVMFLTLKLGFFPWICIAYWIAFWPKEFWETGIGRQLEKFLNLLNPFGGTGPISISPQGTPSKFLIINFLILIVLQNLNTLNFRGWRQPEILKNIGSLVGLSQHWNMFSPKPRKVDGWFVIEGTFLNGKKYNLITGLPKTYSKPKLSFYPHEIDMFWLSIIDDESDQIIPYYAKYLCRKYSERNGAPSSLSKFSIEFVKKITPPHGEKMEDPVPSTLWNHNCFIKSV